MNFIIASLNFTQSTSITDGFNEFVIDRSLLWNYLSSHWSELMAWLSSPYVLAVIAAWCITFTVVITLLLTFGGFGPAGIISGSLAAGFQAWMYGGFTPAAGIFATLTSAGMLGVIVLPYAVISAIIATLVAYFVWVCGVGR